MSNAIRRIFNAIPDTYELVNHIITFGFDNILRRYAAGFAVHKPPCVPMPCPAEAGGRSPMPLDTESDSHRTAPPNEHRSERSSRLYWLDICTGTGDMARALSRCATADTTIIAADFSLPMLKMVSYAKATEYPIDDHSVARRAKDGKYASNTALKIIPAITDAGRLAFQNKTFDVITISFATRNIMARLFECNELQPTIPGSPRGSPARVDHNSLRSNCQSNVTDAHLHRCLREFHRVLKPDGIFINLETSQPTNPVLRQLMHLYVKTVVKPLGGIISGNSTAYGYLSRTIPRFYTAPAFARIISDAGFSEVRYHPVMGGIAAVHIGYRR